MMLSKRLKSHLCAATVATCMLIPLQAYSAGFYIQESSISGLGYAFSGSTTSIDDASTVFFNPAGMTDLNGRQMSLGAHVLVPNSEITDTGSTFDFNGGAPGGLGPISGNDGGNPYSPSPVPNFFFATPTYTDNLWFGFGVSAPFGLANDYDDGWFGRYDSTETELTTINAQPSLAYKINDMVSIGGGIDFQYVDATLESAVSNVTSEGISKLEGDDWTVGFNFGATVKPMDGTEIGIHYRSGIKHELDGRISAQGLNAGNFDVAGSAALGLPDIATFGIAQDVREDLRLFGQATWFGWNNFEEIRARTDAGTTLSNVIQNYQTTWTFSVGAEYDLNEDLTLRAGYQFDETPTTDEYRTSRTPDGDRNWFTLGGTYDWSDDISIDFAGAYIDVADEEINVSRNSGLATYSANTEGTVSIFSLGVNYKF